MAEKPSWKSILGMLALGLAIGAGIGWFFLDDKPPPITHTRHAETTPPPESPTPEPTPAAPLAEPTQRVLALETAGAYLYASIQGVGVMRTKDGVNWNSLGIGLPRTLDVTAFAELRPTQETLAAKMMNPQGGPPDMEAMKKALMDVAQLKPGMLAATAGGLVLRLEDEVWKEISRLPAENGGVYALRYHPAVGLAAATGSGVFFSSDGGASWKPVTRDPATRDVMLSFDPESRYLVATWGHGLQRCDANGKCEKVKNSPERVRRLVGDKEAASGYALTEAEGLYSFEKGRGAVSIPQATLDYAEGWDIAAVGARLAVAAGPEGLWYRDSLKSGWRAGDGLPPDSVTTVAFFGRKVFAGTRGYGLFVADLRDLVFHQTP